MNPRQHVQCFASVRLGTCQGGLSARPDRPERTALHLLIAAAALTAACSTEPKTPSTAQRAPSTSQHMPIGQMPTIDVEALLAHTRTLSSDAYEGRAPGTKGEELTVAYIADEFRKVGLKPGNTDGTYFQKVPLVGITPRPAPLVFAKGGQHQTLKWKDDVVAWTKHVAPSAGISN